jgi:predicted  nucleic acid-binding Zn-ribbon protein
VASVCTAIALAAALTRGAGAQTASADPMTALLSEVHALRLAMEQSASIAPRVQLTLARLNIEEQRITQLAAQLDQVRRELSGTELLVKRTADQIVDLEKGVQMAPDEKTRKDLEYEQTQAKREQSRHAIQLQQIRTRENEATQLLSAEQARWIELNARLDELERLLGPLRQ